MSKSQRDARRKPATKLSLIEMQGLFDETDELNMERRQAIADCMGIPLKQAIKESEQRIKDADRIPLAKSDHKSKGH